MFLKKGYFNLQTFQNGVSILGKIVLERGVNLEFWAAHTHPKNTQVPPPPGVRPRLFWNPGGWVLPHMGYIGMCVQNRVSFSMKQISWLKILVQTRKIGNCLPKIKKNQIGKFKFTQLSLKGTLRQEGCGEFSLVQGSKIQLNQLWYRLRVPESLRHIPTMT